MCLFPDASMTAERFINGVALEETDIQGGVYMQPHSHMNVKFKINTNLQCLISIKVDTNGTNDHLHQKECDNPQPGRYITCHIEQVIRVLENLTLNFFVQCKAQLDIRYRHVSSVYYKDGMGNDMHVMYSESSK